MIKQFFKDTPNSVFFWNGLALLVFSILCSMGEQTALGTMFLVSIPEVFMIMINWEDRRYTDGKIIGYHWWAYLAPGTWAIMLIVLVVGGIVWIVLKGSEYAGQFNNWLNKK